MQCVSVFTRDSLSPILKTRLWIMYLVFPLLDLTWMIFMRLHNLVNNACLDGSIARNINATLFSLFFQKINQKKTLYLATLCTFQKTIKTIMQSGVNVKLSHSFCCAPSRERFCASKKRKKENTHSLSLTHHLPHPTPQQTSFLFPSWLSSFAF